MFLHHIKTLPRAFGGIPHIFSRVPFGPQCLCVSTVSTQAVVGHRNVVISEHRLESFLEAELVTLLQGARPYLALTDLLKVVEGLRTPSGVAVFLHQELSVRIAQRINLIMLLHGWEDVEPISDIHNMYMDSFRQLRLSNPHHVGEFTKLVQIILKRHARTNRLVGGFRQHNFKRERLEVDNFLEKFFTLRISANMLIDHFLMLTGHHLMKLVDQHCNPGDVAEAVATSVRMMCHERYGYAPNIEVVRVNEGATFRFVPRYLAYICSELLKNACRASVNRHIPGPHAEMKEYSKDLHYRQQWEDTIPPVRVIVSCDKDTCSMCISDQGGGIAVQDLPLVWSYLHTTAKPVESLEWGVDGPRHGLDAKSPLAGLGCGLPLARLYARYLGGTINLQTLPGYGTDVFIYLTCMSTQSKLNGIPGPMLD